MIDNRYLAMSPEDIELIQEAKSWRNLDSAGAIRIQEWLRRNFDPAANYCSTCGDSVRALYHRCISLWDMFGQEIIEHNTKTKNKL